MTSEHVTELLSAYIDGELSQDELERVESHLEHCPECQQELAGLRQTVGLVRSLPQLELPDDYHASLRRRLLVDSMGRERSGRTQRAGATRGLLARIGRMRRTTWAGLAAAALIIVVVVVWTTGGLFGPGLGLIPSKNQEDASLRESYGLTGSGAPGATEEPATEPPVASESGAPSKEAPAPEGDYAQSSPGVVPDTNASILSLDRKIIRTAQFDIEVEDAHKAYQQVMMMAETMGGFVQESSQQTEGERLRAYLIIRVPANNFSRAVEELGAMGDVSNQHMSGQDVTQEYVDMDSRVKTLQAKESSLMTLLGQATTVDDILKVERELWSVREQIEQLQGRMRYYDNLTSLSTIQVTLYEPSPVPPKNEPDTLLDQLIEALVNSVKYLGYYAGRLLVALTWVLPYAAIAVIIWWLVRLGLHRRTSD